jgi:hypothetical protein
LPHVNFLEYFIINHEAESTYLDFNIDSFHPTAYRKKVMVEIEKTETYTTEFVPWGSQIALCR